MNSLGNKKVNEDLMKERAKCTFDITELIYFLDKGKQNTEQRRKFEEYAFSVKEFKDPVPEDYLSHKEKYENAIRKSCILAKLVRESLQSVSATGLDAIGINGPIARVAQAVLKNVSPFFLHFGMFVPTIMGQGDAEQQLHWLPRALEMNILGAYAQTELGHGTFIRGLETTATYDAETEEFVLHSPTLSSFKWWPGGMGQTANHCIVTAQMYTKGECHGVHNFIVQIREEETHMPRAGVKVGDIGPKMGFNTADNGYLGFDNYRVPRNALLMKHSQVLKNGTYVKPQNKKLTYGTMVYVRVSLVKEVSFQVAKAAIIAVRYSAVRRQSQLKPDEPEPQILDYVTQQHKLFISIATSYALSTAGKWLWNTYNKVIQDIRNGNTENLPELHALACCLKAVSTADAASCIEQCRLACGGHGYMLSSNLPLLYSLVTATCTYEGDNTVLLLQTARYLVKAWEQAASGVAQTPTLAYLTHAYKNRNRPWHNTTDNVIGGFQAVAAGKVSACVKSLDKRVKSGLAYEDAWNMTSVQLTKAAEAHCRAVLIETYWNETQRTTVSLSAPTRAVLHALAELYLVYWALEKTGDLLQYTRISEKDILELQARYEQLLTILRPDAVAIVDSFDIRDEILNSTLGSYDGRVYERLMEEALKSPLNAEPVNRSFHTHLKPFMQGKL